MKVKGAKDMMNGLDDLFKNNSSILPSMQPIQMLPKDKKDYSWIKLNADFVEFQGLMQIREKSKKYLKNFKLAAGELDRSTYIAEERDPDYKDVYDMVVNSENPLPDAMDLQFFPLIPSYFNVLLNEHSQRGASKIDYRAIDGDSVNEIIDLKQKEMQSVMLKYGENKMLKTLIDAGYPMNDPSIAEKLELPNLMEEIPAIYDFYKKDYRSMYEIWATKQHQIDYQRFKFEELERTSFGDYLTNGCCYWYLEQGESDYRIRVLDSVLTFHHNSPNEKWASNGNYGGFFEVLSTADIIDMCGEDMEPDDFKVLENLSPGFASQDLAYMNGGTQDETKWDASKSYAENKRYGVGMRQNLAMDSALRNSVGKDIVDYVIGQTADKALMHDTGLLRMATLFWKSQRKVGMLFEIMENGESRNPTIVDETFVTQINPVYNTKFQNVMNVDTLVFGQHVDWFWINEVWGVRKITGPHVTFSSMTAPSQDDKDCADAIYLGIGQNKPGPLKYQFKSDLSRWGCKLPIEGGEFSTRNSKTKSMVDLLKPAQILFDISNNQLTDIMSDETGPVVALDQNSLPKHSIDGSWGKNNFIKARGVMQEYNMLLLDNTLANTESATNFSHMQVLNMEETNRLLSRMSISRYAKELASDVMGFSPARLAQQSGVTSGTSTATELEQMQTGSYTRTESYFIEHDDKLMPRVHEMRTGLAQYYHSNNPSLILRQMVSPDERALFEIDGTKLSLAEMQIFIDNNSQRRSLLNEIRRWVISTNTNGASLIDGIDVMKVDSLIDLEKAVQKAEDRKEKKEEVLHQRQMELLDKEAQLKQAEIDKQNNFKALQNMLQRQVDILREEIRASGYAAQSDLNNNNQSDQADIYDRVEKEKVFQETMRSKDQERVDQRQENEANRQVEREKIQADLVKSGNTVTVAKVNK